MIVIHPSLEVVLYDQDSTRMEGERREEAEEKRKEES